MKNARPIAGASVAGLLVVILWIGIAYFTGYELGLCAWVTGGCVGLAFSALNGHGGKRAGACCATIAVVSILLGKPIALAVSVNGIKKQLKTDYQREKSIVAPEFVKATTPGQRRAFLVKYKYTYSETARDVTDEELDNFDQVTGARLLAVDRGLSYDDWFETESVRSLVDSSTRLTLFGIALGILGIVTAFKLGADRRPKAASPSGMETESSLSAHAADASDSGENEGRDESASTSTS